MQKLWTTAADFWHRELITLTDILRRIFDATFEWGEKQADREIDGFVARSSGTFTDNIEREMMQRNARR